MLGILSQRRQSTAIFSSIIKMFDLKQREGKRPLHKSDVTGLSLSLFLSLPSPFTLSSRLNGGGVNVLGVKLQETIRI